MALKVATDVPKPVNFTGVLPQMFFAAYVMAEIYKDLYGVDCWITSANDGDHQHVLHYVGCAMDFRIRHLPYQNAAERVVQEAKERLGPQYDVVLERTHIHVEWDIRRVAGMTRK